MAHARIGQYDVLRLLGRGPRGENYLGEDRRDGRRVAVRILAVGGPDRERAIEDARKVAAVTHPHVAESKVGLHDDEPFIATEYLDGSGLDAWVKEKHLLSDQIRVIAGIADALTFCHGRGVLHRNLKPSNVYVLPDGECKLLDFGVGPEGGLATATAAHLAPEVREGGPSSEKADIWSAGALFYEVLAGKRPDPEAPQALRDVRRDVKQELTDAVMACLEKDPDWRPKDLTYILEMCRGAGPAAPARVAGAPAKGASSTANAPPTLPSLGGKKSEEPNRVPAFVGVVAGVLIAAAAGWYFLRPALAPPARVDKKAAPPPPTAPPETTAPAPTPATPKTPTPRVAPPQPEATVATPTPRPTPTPVVARATPEETRPAPAAATPTPEAVVERPVATPAPASVEPAAPLEPATLKTLTPPSVRRKATGILDLHGTSLRAEHRAIILKGRAVAKGISVVRQRLVSGTLLQVAIQVDEAAEPGGYTVELADDQGRSTNSLRFEVAK